MLVVIKWTKKPVYVTVRAWVHSVKIAVKHESIIVLTVNSFTERHNYKIRQKYNKTKKKKKKKKRDKKILY